MPVLEQGFYGAGGAARDIASTKMENQEVCGHGITQCLETGSGKGSPPSKCTEERNNPLSKGRQFGG